jgi:hypothetical protein
MPMSIGGGGGQLSRGERTGEDDVLCGGGAVEAAADCSGQASSSNCKEGFALSAIPLLLPLLLCCTRRV